MQHTEPPNITPLYVVAIFAALAFLAAAFFMTTGCTGPLVTVDKSIHVAAFVNADKLSRVAIETKTTNTSDTTADGNTASAEADVSIPLIP